MTTRPKKDNNAKLQHKKFRPNPAPVGPVALAAADRKIHIPQPPVAHPVTQEELVAEPVSTAGSHQRTSYDLPTTFSTDKDI